MKKLNVEGLGQVFTKNHTIDILLSLRKNKTNLVLEPSCGDGAISNKLQNCVSIEIDNKVAPDYAINIDFFDYSIDNKFDTIIGNPPFVKYNDIFSSTKNKLEKYGSVFDKRTNLYISFIYKCIEHLTKNGELIFIVPREFLKATSSINVNNFLFENGTITDFIDMGDCKLFGDFTPNCIIFRFEKGNFSYKTKYQTAKINDNKILLSKIENRTFKNMNGQLVFTNANYSVKLSDIFSVKVGAVSGNDKIFANESGNMNFVTSETITTGKTKKFFFNINAKELQKFKKVLLKRKIKKFNDTDWFTWGRKHYISQDERIYVNAKTRKENPFFYNKCKNYDGSIIALILKVGKDNVKKLIEDLNSVNWEELGFVCNGRFIFSQKSLENCLLPDIFKKYLKINNINNGELEYFNIEFIKRHDFESPELDLFLNRWKNKTTFTNIPEAWIIPLDTMMFSLNSIDKNPISVRQEYGQLIVSFKVEDIIKGSAIVIKAKEKIESIDQDLYQLFDMSYIKKKATNNMVELMFKE